MPAGDVPLQPLRIPAGWEVQWNILAELEPTPENVAGKRFGGDASFYALHTSRPFFIDVAWRPEDDPEGCFVLLVLHSTGPVSPTGHLEREGRSSDWEHPLHRAEIRTLHELVVELEKWLEWCSSCSSEEEAALIGRRDAAEPPAASLHDNIVLGWGVSCERRELTLRTAYLDREPYERTGIRFRRVEAYHLIGDTLRSVLFDVEETPLEEILREYSGVFEEGARYSWPGTWNRSPEACLAHFAGLACRGWRVSASCGIDGFVIAGEMEIRSEPLPAGEACP